MELAERAGAPGDRLRRVGRRAHGRRHRGAGRLRADLPHNVRLSGRVPQISVISGVSAGGGAYSPALTDFVVMTEESAMFLTGPGVVREVMGEDVDAAGLGGPRVHSENGVCQFVAEDDLDAVRARARPARVPPPAAPARSRRSARPAAVPAVDPSDGRARSRAPGLRHARRDRGARGRRRACSRCRSAGRATW